MFRALLTHSQEDRTSYALMTMYINTFKYLLIAACNIPSADCVAPPEDEQVMLVHVEARNS
jgi:hypothetical protein